MPVILNEPLGALQKCCEDLEYYEFLNKAALPNISPIDRITYIALFAISSYHSCQFRASTKPFNPLLGETFEYQNESFKFIAEQVSHHPPLSAAYAISHNKTWKFLQVMRYKTKFWGRSMELLPSGSLMVTIDDEEYKWNKITTCIQGLISGQRSVSNYGDIILTCKKTNLECKISFEKKGWGSSAPPGQITGKIYNLSRPNKPLDHLMGSWMDKVSATNQNPTLTNQNHNNTAHAGDLLKIWKGKNLPVNSESLYYGFSHWAMNLNNDQNYENTMLDPLPTTDCRFRPDQRALENADLVKAESEKLRLEQQQRERRKQREENPNLKNFSPKWFIKTGSSDEDFIYNENNCYFKSKENKFVGEDFEGPLW